MSFRYGRPRPSVTDCPARCKGRRRLPAGLSARPDVGVKLRAITPRLAFRVATRPGRMHPRWHDACLLGDTHQVRG
jgi:hypothetical protein